MKFFVFALCILFTFNGHSKTKAKPKAALSHNEYKALNKKQRVEYSNNLRKLGFKNEIIKAIKKKEKQKSKKSKVKKTSFRFSLIEQAHAQTPTMPGHAARPLSDLPTDHRRWWICSRADREAGRTQSCGPRYGVNGNSPYCVPPAQPGLVISPYGIRVPPPGSQPLLAAVEIADIIMRKCETVAYATQMQQLLGADYYANNPETYEQDIQRAEEICAGEYGNLLIECAELNTLERGDLGGVQGVSIERNEEGVIQTTEP